MSSMVIDVYHKFKSILYQTTCDGQESNLCDVGSYDDFPAGYGCEDRALLVAGQVGV